MLEKIINKIPFKNTLLAGLFCLGLGGCGAVATYEDVSEVDESSSIYFTLDTSESDLYCEEKKYYGDSDNDGFGDPNREVFLCGSEKGYVDNDLDCDDENKDVHPNAFEQCNQKDDNCNDLTDEYLEFKDWYEDADGDGFGTEESFLKDCKQPAGYVDNDLDCNDDNQESNPNGKEICDGFDNNCNGQTDEDFVPQDCSTDCGEGFKYCEDGKWTDCDAPKPQAEICDGIDNDCNGSVDEGLEQKLWFVDDDGDGSGTINKHQIWCEQPEGYVGNNLDCNDSDPTIKTGDVLWRSENIECSTVRSQLALDYFGRVLVNNKEGKLFAFNSGDGASLWDSSEENVAVANSPVISEDGTIYVTNTTLFSYGLYIHINAFNNLLEKKWDGSSISNHCDGPGWASGAWDYFSSHPLSLSSNGKIYATAGAVDYDWDNEYCGYIEAINSFGDKEWIYSSISYPLTAITIGPEETIYTGRDKFLYSLLPNGKLKKKIDLGNLIDDNFKTPPVFSSNNILYFTTTGHDLVAYDQNANDVLWKKANWGKNSPLIDAEGNIFAFFNNETESLTAITYAKFDSNGNLIAGKPLGELYDGALASIENNYDEVNQSEEHQLFSKVTNVFYGYGENGLFALSNSGATNWELKVDPETNNGIIPTNLAIGTNGNLYFCNAVDNKVYSVCASHSLDDKALWPIARHDNQRTGNFNKE
jgi:hypothetical protein